MGHAFRQAFLPTDSQSCSNGQQEGPQAAGTEIFCEIGLTAKNL